MKIRLLEDLPVAREHGATKGRVFEAREVSDTERRRSPAYWWINGDSGGRVGVLYREAEVVEGEENADG